MIQNRITMVTCSQPSISKWCCNGVIRNTRCCGPTRKIVRTAWNRREALKKLTWTITDSVITTKSPPMMSRSSSVRVRIARPARAPPRPRDPVSPMMIAAGEAFHHRNPKQAPMIAAETTARSRGSRTS
jgi:hypothetical protein